MALLTLFSCHISQDTMPTTEAPAPTMSQNEPQDHAQPPRPIEPVKANHFILIGQPIAYAPMDCAVFDTAEAPHRQPAQPLHDATDYPERLQVPMAFLESIQNPTDIPIHSPAQPQLQADQKPRTTNVAFALGTRAFRTPEAEAHASAYNSAYCARLNSALSSRFVVIHAYHVHKDRGNSDQDLWRESWGSLGTDPGKATAGFATLPEAQAYAAQLLLARPDGTAPSSAPKVSATSL